MMLKLSVGQLALAVLACGVAARAISSPTPLWGVAILSSAVAVCSLALLGALFARGPRRASFAIAAACGWAYLFASLGPWASERIAPALVTGAAIDRLFNAIRRSDTIREMLHLQIEMQHLAMMRRRIARSTSDPQKDPEFLRVREEAEKLRSEIVRLGAIRERYVADTEADPDDPWSSWNRLDWGGPRTGHVPPSKPFRRIGHGLFAIAFALAGGAFGRFIAGRGAADEARPADPTTA